jgi:hypothetical protein
VARKAAGLLLRSDGGAKQNALEIFWTLCPAFTRLQREAATSMRFQRLSGKYLGYVWNLIEAKAARADIMEAAAVYEVVLEAAAALWSLTIASDTQESLWKVSAASKQLNTIIAIDYFNCHFMPLN